MKKVVKMLTLCILALSMLVIPAAASTGSVNATLDYQDIKILIGGEEIKPVDVNGESAEPFAINGSTYLPVRAIAQALGYDVTWDGATNTVSLTGAGQTDAEPVTADPNCDFKVITLGTGAPPPDDRSGQSILVDVNGQQLMFDAGRGAMTQLYAAGYSADDVDMVFITHLHSDHTVGLPDLYLTGLLNGPFGQRHRPFAVTGVEGTKTMMDHIKLAYGGDIEIRTNDGEIDDPSWHEIVVTEFHEDGVVYEKDGVTVTAFENFHGENIPVSYGYRIDYDGRSVVISGDTKYCENLIEHAQGVDLLLHSAGMANEELLKQDTPLAEKAKTILNHHTPPEDLAKVFQETAPKLAALNHGVIVSIAANRFPQPTLEDIAQRTRDYGYTGPLEIARDLMTFEIGETVRVIPSQK